MNAVRHGPWAMGILTWTAMALLAAATDAELCEGLGCLGMYLIWTACIGIACGTIGTWLFYRASQGRWAVAIPAALSLAVLTWVVCVLAGQAYLFYAADEILAEPAYLGMITAGAAIVAGLGFWGRAAARRGGFALGIYAGMGLLVLVWPASVMVGG
ncbi:MAG TPA: hypothetical protein VF062_25295 [Candidatus Limnocylindrales bacterium]